MMFPRTQSKKRPYADPLEGRKPSRNSSRINRKFRLDVMPLEGRCLLSVSTIAGPIINPAVQALILTPVCPHTLTHRPLIVPANAEIEVVLTSKDDGAMATLDGQVGVAMTQGDTVEIKASEHLTRLIRFPESSYYEVLREKLKWGDG